MSDLDTSFATVGFTTTGFGFIPPNQSHSRAIALQTDGKIVMAGDTKEDFNLPLPGGVKQYVAVCRYNTNGALDNSFGTGGLSTFLIQTTPPGGPSITANSLVIQPNGSIVVCGYVLDNTASFYQIFVVRFNSSGILDTTTFAAPNGYIVITPTAFNTAYPLNAFTDCYAESVQIDTGITPNKIVIGGYVRGFVPPSVVPIHFFALARLDLNGTLDSSFGANGLVAKNFTGLDEFGFSLAIGLGKYFLAGRQGITTPTYKFIVSKFDNLGNPVGGFGTGGVTVIPAFLPLTVQEARSMLVQPDGKIVLAGTSFTTAPFPSFQVSSYALARLDGNTGALDAMFGTGGTVITNLSFMNFDLTGYSVAIQLDGKIILAGQYFDTSTSLNSSFSLARYNVNGSLDTTFGVNGNGLILENLVSGTVLPGTMQEAGFSVAIQTDGKILVGGQVGEFSDISDDVEFILARYLSFPPSPPLPIPIAPICFPAGTPVTTDQGTVAIEHLNPGFHTINSKPIVAVTKSYLNQDKVVCVERHSLGMNVPNAKTYISNDHHILYKNRLIPANRFVGKLRGIFYVRYTGETMYNVLMEKHHIMKVNNMKVETLHPRNIVAFLYTNKHSSEEKMKMILKINETYSDCEKQSRLKYMNHNFTRRNLTILRHNPLFINLKSRTKKHFLPHRTNGTNWPHHTTKHVVKIHKNAALNHSRRHG